MARRNVAANITYKGEIAGEEADQLLIEAIEDQLGRKIMGFTRVKGPNGETLRYEFTIVKPKEK